VLPASALKSGASSGKHESECDEAAELSNSPRDASRTAVAVLKASPTKAIFERIKLNQKISFPQPLCAVNVDQIPS
jgi:hypothetical protein